MSEWSAAQYSKFAKERTLPADNLADAVIGEYIRSILDVGCGIGNSTAVLRKKFPDAEIIGVDNSEDMLNAARKNNPDIKFIRLDAGKNISNLNRKFDVVFSNACIQWIPNHRNLLGNLMELLHDKGVLAVQIPQQAKHPMHKVIERISSSEKWSQKISVPRVFYTLTEEEYFDILSELSDNFRIWETTYFHVMPSHQSIVEWYKGTGLRPFLEQLDNADKTDFEQDILLETEKTYPVQQNGQIIFRFPRLFFTAQKHS